MVGKFSIFGGAYWLAQPGANFFGGCKLASARRREGQLPWGIRKVGNNKEVSVNIIVGVEAE
jgi:hypothetical protein